MVVGKTNELLDQRFWVEGTTPWWLRHCVALLLFAIAATVAWSIPAASATVLFFSFLLVVAIAAWIAGAGATVLVANLSLLALLGLVTHRFTTLPRRIDVVRLILFLAIAAFVSLLTQRKRRVSEGFRVLVESAPDAIIGVEKTGAIVLVNSQAEQLFGYDRSELFGNSIELLVPERFRHTHSMHRHDFREHPRTRAMGGMELKARRKDGSEFPAEISLSPLRTERGLLVTSIIRDVSERKRAEESRLQLIREQTARAEAEAMQRRLHDLVQDLDAIVWEGDIASRRFTFVSDHAEQLLGYPPAGWIGDSRFWLRHVHPEDRGNVVSFFRHLGAGGTSTVEYRAIAANGDVMWLRNNVYVVRGDDGAPRCLRGVMVDITARKQTEESLRTAEKLAATGRLAASIAHEINNPMAAVINLLYLLDHHPSLDDSAKHYVKLAQDEILRVAQITRQMLGFYRDSVAAERVNIPEVISSILSLYRRRLEESRIRVSTDIDAIHEVHAFPGEVRQVFSNLLLNAVEAVQKGGTINIRVRSWRDWRTSEGPGVRVTFADNGTGIERAHMSRIFEPFFTTKGQNGTGLGLWVSHGIVQKHGGTIRVRSSVGPWHRGTTFSVFLPSQPAQQRARQAAA